MTGFTDNSTQFEALRKWSAFSIKRSCAEILSMRLSIALDVHQCANAIFDVSEISLRLVGQAVHHWIDSLAHSICNRLVDRGSTIFPASSRVLIDGLFLFEGVKASVGIHALLIEFREGPRLLEFKRSGLNLLLEQSPRLRLVHVRSDQIENLLADHAWHDLTLCVRTKSICIFDIKIVLGVMDCVVDQAIQVCGPSILCRL